MRGKMHIRVRYLGILLFGLLVACSGGNTDLPPVRPSGTISGNAV